MASQSNSPLRYPGGKSVLLNFFKDYISENKIDRPIYVEPYCGGAGAALGLLFNNDTNKIWLNDASFSIYSFWLAVKLFGEDFINKVYETEVTLENWVKQKAILDSNHFDPKDQDTIFNKGFATFFLNRCNRSGILTAGPIGGKSLESQREANYKIDARFNKEALVKKLEKIISRKDDIIVTNLDALDLLKVISDKKDNEFQRNCFVYLDPPYYRQGSSLYLNFYNHNDHEKISTFLSQNHIWKWVLSYDNVVEIRKLYKNHPRYTFYINYSAQEAKLGSELLIHSSNSVLPKSLIIKELKSSNKRIQLENLMDY